MSTDDEYHLARQLCADRENLMYRNVIGLICVCAIGAAGSYAFLQHDRYSILLLQEDSVFIKAYKIDRNTGKVWWIGQDESDLVNDRSSIRKVVLPPEQRAINLVRSSETGITDEKIKGLLQARKGILKVHGWKLCVANYRTHYPPVR
jgi:hypothetical protein